MKKLLSLLFTASLLFIIFSCGGGKSGNEEESSKESKAETELKKKIKGEGESISNCEDFLDRYEEWVDLYIKTIKEYKENPYDSETLQRYGEAMSKASVWAQDWTKLYACAMREKYQKRFEEIAKKANKAFEELEIK